jgi:crotonobetainyl-CoA:carnitine CoA-transferase CaiB-like acyl-CoA transferase
MIGLRAINRRAIVCHISGFGQDGPGRAWPAYDLIVQGMGGIMSLTGDVGQDPVMVGVPAGRHGRRDVRRIRDRGGALRARAHRRRTGRRRDDARWPGRAPLAAGREILRRRHRPAAGGNVHASIVPYQTFRTSDGHVNVGVANNALFERFCRALDLDELLHDARFADNPARVAHGRRSCP